MTGLVLLAAPPTTEHLRLRIELSGGECDELLFWDRRGLGLVRLVTPEEFDKLYGGGKARSRCADTQRATTCNRGSATAAARSRWRCSISGRWPASAICTPARSCTWPAFIPAVAATACARPNGSGSTRPCSKCSRWPFCTKARPCPTAPIATPSTSKAAIRITIGFTIEPANLCPSCRRAKIERIVQAQRSTFFCAAASPAAARLARHRLASRSVDHGRSPMRSVRCGFALAAGLVSNWPDPGG